MKPFNLERALAGDPVVTKAGEPVEQLHKFDTIDMKCIFGVVEGEVYSWRIGGEFYEEGESDKDLFMATKKCSGWINISKDHNGDIRVSEYPYMSRVGAMNNASVNVVDTILIEWEE